MVVIIDYKSGNTRSVYNAINNLKVNVKISSNINDIKKSSAIILPGVGSYNQCMELLKKNGLLDVLYEEVIVNKKLFLGICVGMQILSDFGLENKKTKGLGWIAGEVKKIDVGQNYVLPHMGWNNLIIKKNSLLLKNLINDPTFYFVHSFAINPKDKSLITSTCDYGEQIISSIEKDNIFAVQFHPEKSQYNGLTLLKNFLDLR